MQTLKLKVNQVPPRMAKMILAVSNIQFACRLLEFVSIPDLCIQVQQIPGSRSRLSLLNTQLRAVLACLGHAKADNHQEAPGTGDYRHAVCVGQSGTWASVQILSGLIDISPDCVQAQVRPSWLRLWRS